MLAYKGWLSIVAVLFAMVFLPVVALSVRVRGAAKTAGTVRAFARPASPGNMRLSEQDFAHVVELAVARAGRVTGWYRCLSKALTGLLICGLLGRGHGYAVVVGVNSPKLGFQPHAWLSARNPSSELIPDESGSGLNVVLEL